MQNVGSQHIDFLMTSHFNMTEENPTSCFAQMALINLNVYLKTGSNWSTSEHKIKTSQKQFLEVIIF